MKLATRSTKKLPQVVFGPTFPYRTPAGFACFVCNKSGMSLLQGEGLCTKCPTASLNVRAAAKLVEHMAIHILFDDSGCDGAIRIDMTRSHCPNLASLGLATAMNSSKKSPCTNRPLLCPISPCPDSPWKYKHIETVHPTAVIINYESYYALAEGEEAALKAISTAKKRKSSKKRINIGISQEHSTDRTLG
ncbi:hypothetical protein DFH07DRAFT_770651 [Mycena maculata]|uniref:Uncharacterized protein n=1 Tax=Mycena maculata TaxID=230809 RepID=A0AAD7NJN8_9AGAR|nr:hypothetical protein DFH07DRAFT_770651 [Mycena maculata]